MSMHDALFGAYPIPTETAELAHSIHPTGNLCMQLRDHFGMLYENHQFVTLFSSTGQPALAPARLALVTIMQFIEGLSDRQAADAVRDRISWKYALGLPLNDRGFHFSVLSAFRTRIGAGELEQIFLDTILHHFRDAGLLRSRGQQRTDSTHVLAAVRGLSRIECVGETMRATLNALATAAPAWLRAHIPTDWFDRYGPRFDSYRFPKDAAARQVIAEQIGTDGCQLLSLLASSTTPVHLPALPAVTVLRQVWWQQYYAAPDRVQWRAVADLPPGSLRIHSPYDVEARFSLKRATTWTGYKVHITEVCDSDRPHLITQVLTTAATTGDVSVVAPIHAVLAGRDLLPAIHIVDAGYTDAAEVLASEATYGIKLHGPVARDGSWQAKDSAAFDLTHFRIDWDAKEAICPQGHASAKWIPHQDTHGNPAIRVTFRPQICRACPVRPHCTHTAVGARGLSLRPQAQHETLTHARQQQRTTTFKQQYALRAGIEGTMSQATRVCGMRQSRYIGLAKTRVQHVITASALNLLRGLAWLDGQPHRQVRPSRFAALRPPAAGV